MMSDRTVVVTGSTDGVGRAVVEKLAAPGVHLLVHGRDAERGERVVDSVECAGGSARFLKADFSSLADVCGFADTVRGDYPQIDVLVNNAGISKPGGQRHESADGYELHFAINYLAPFLLTRLLCPQLGVRAPSTVVNVVSAAQAALDFEDLMLVNGYDGFRAYGQSKLAEVMLAFDLAEVWEGGDLTANCLHPGTHMDTTMVREAGVTPANTVDGAADAVVALTAPRGVSGRYFDVRRESRAHHQAYDRQARRKLEEISLGLTGLEA